MVEILDAELLENFENFKKEITNLISETDLVDKITNKNYKEQVIEFELEFAEKEVFATLSFKFIKLDKI